MNTNPVTGYRYTVYSCSKLRKDVLAGLRDGKDVTYAAAEAEEIRRQHRCWEEACETASVLAQEDGQPAPTFNDFEPDLEGFDPQIAEPEIAGEKDGVEYYMAWLGGAQVLWVLESPIIGHFQLRGSDVPGACDGDKPTSRVDGCMAYAVPPDWLHIDPDPRSFNECMEEYE